MSYPLFGVVHSARQEEVAVEVLRSGQIAAGPYIERFRAAFADLIDNPRTVTVNDMSNAMLIALRLAGVQAGHEVITSPYSCLSTNAPLGISGAKLVWADIDPDTATLDVASVERAITPNTRAVVLYHVAGYPGPAAALLALCRERGVALIEDCDNALGATIDGRPVGSFADYAVYSFYPNRQINAIDGGALSVRTDEEYGRALRLRKYGIDPLRFRDGLGEIDPTVDVPELGWPAILNNLSSAIGSVQLEGLDDRLARTRSNAEQLRKNLAGLSGIELVQPLAGADPAYWAVLLRAEHRDVLMRNLKSHGVAASKLHHRNDDYSGFNASRSLLPGLDHFMQSVLALPCGWWLDKAAIDEIATHVQEGLVVHA
jgi:perosamine synthetase